jgi:L-lactate dehydrogenase (cytochrome)
MPFPVGFNQLPIRVCRGTELTNALIVLRDEIETTMRLCGMTDLMKDAHPDLVNTLEVDHLVPTDSHPYARKITRRQSRL